MAMEYTEEQLNNLDKATLVQLFLVQQAQLKDIDTKLQLLLEQVAVLNNHRFGKSSEKLDVDDKRENLDEPNSVTRAVFKEGDQALSGSNELRLSSVKGLFAELDS